MIDNVRFKQRTTLPPTTAPTYEPTKAKTIGPTLKPTMLTSAPTTSLVVPCPPVGEVVNLAPGNVILSIAEADTLCTVTKVIPKTLLGGETTQTIVPLVRSYDKNTWESSAGNAASSSFENEYILCYDQGCQIYLPAIEVGEEYQLSSKLHTVNHRDEFARFLETASFGTTASELDLMEAMTGQEGPIGVIADFVATQMDDSLTPMTSHRKYWRSRSNARVIITFIWSITLYL